MAGGSRGGGGGGWGAPCFGATSVFGGGGGGGGDNRTHHLDSAVPGAGAELVLVDEVPVDGEDFAVVLLPGLDGELFQTKVEELYRAIAGGDEDLVLMRLGPGEVEKGVLGIEPVSDRSVITARQWRLQCV